jgi:large subunit GTPase 1
MPRNQGTSRKGKPKKFEKAAGMGRSLLATGKKYTPRSDGKNRLGGVNGMAAVPGVTSIGESADLLLSSSTGGMHPRSILDMHDLDDFLLQASMAQREFVSERGTVDDQTMMMIVPERNRKVQWKDQAPPPSANLETTVMELSVPRRPPWTADTSREELEQQEQAAFLEWRRSIARYEATLLENASALSSIAPTPFEKNLNVWRQLWRVVERCHVVLQIVDARNPLFYLSYDLYKYVHLELGKPMMLVFNKSDYLTPPQRQQWLQYLKESSSTSSSATSTATIHWTANCRIVFFSAAREQKRLDAEAARERHRVEEEEMKGSTPSETVSKDVLQLDTEEDDEDEFSEEEDHEIRVVAETGEGAHVTLHEEKANDERIEEHDEEWEETADLLLDPVEPSATRILSRSELIQAMRSFAQEHDCQPDERYEHRIQFGMVGFPNVGKSSVINVLMGTSKHAHGTVRVAVASQPGKTKHFQTLLLPEPDSDSMLCDCPGLVFPSFVSNTADLIAAGVYPIAQMRDFWPVMELICQRIPRAILNAHYGITLPVPTQQELRESGFVSGGADGRLPLPTVDELLTTYCVARGFLASFSGVPDYQRAARIIIKDYADGKLLYCHPPPFVADIDTFLKDTTETALRQTQRTRERLLKQQQKVEALNAATNGPVASSSVNRKTKAADAMDDEFLQQMIGPTLDATGEGKSKHHFKKKAGSRWGKKDRKNRNKDPYGCHSTPDNSLLQGVAVSASVYPAAGPTSGSNHVRPTTFPVLTTGSKT